MSQSKNKIPSEKTPNNIIHKSISTNYIADNEFSKVAQKLDYDYLITTSPPKTSSNKKNKIANTEMKLFSMEHSPHNVDLVNSAYIKKVNFSFFLL